ncbi:MAG: hypothetical protein PSX71_05375 [bacterium]|nr:hypothetical protein [bacterium]
MKLIGAFAALLLLAACSGPPGADKKSSFNPGPDCQGACASGYRWALDNEVTNKGKCRGENEFSRGCKREVDFARPFAQ